jgi:hypothetical protein
VAQADCVARAPCPVGLKHETLNNDSTTLLLTAKTVLPALKRLREHDGWKAGGRHNNETDIVIRQENKQPKTAETWVNAKMMFGRAGICESAPSEE